jgi:hypothetical protein
MLDHNQLPDSRTRYRVLLWLNRDNGYIEIPADSAQEAAEKACGCSLREQGGVDKLRALVRLSAPAPGMSTPINFYAA